MNRDKVAKAIEDAVRPFGLRLHDSDGVKLWAYPDRDMFRVLLVPIVEPGMIAMSTLNKPKGSA